MKADNRILLFGGTTEGRKMARILSEKGFFVTVCVATQTGAEYLKGIPSLRILTGRKDAVQMLQVMREGYLCCIDATHPYAVEATRCIRASCSKAKLPCLRYLRPKVPRQELERIVAELVREYRQTHAAASGKEWEGAWRSGRFPLRVTECDSVQEACRLIPGQGTPEPGMPEQGRSEPGTPQQRSPLQRVLVTTGAKECSLFAPLPGVYVRVLPSEESIRLCREAGFAGDHIITGSGPFTVEDNVRVMEDLRIGTIVTKDGGIEGGYPQKLAAAALCGVRVIVIRRSAEEGMTRDEILDFVLSKAAE